MSREERREREMQVELGLLYSTSSIGSWTAPPPNKLCNEWKHKGWSCRTVMHYPLQNVVLKWFNPLMLSLRKYDSLIPVMQHLPVKSIHEYIKCCFFLVQVIPNHVMSSLSGAKCRRKREHGTSLDLVKSLVSVRVWYRQPSANTHLLFLTKPHGVSLTLHPQSSLPKTLITPRLVQTGALL